MMAKGLTNPEIAATLGYSESTVRRESVILFSKLGVHNRHDAGNLLLNIQQIKDNNMDNFFPAK
jgi:DNA-binding NarL/FixJ family response regulator